MIPTGSLRLRRQTLAVLFAFVALTHLPILAQTPNRGEPSAAPMIGGGPQRTNAPLQRAITANRITESIDGSRVQALPDHLPRWANAGNDQGPAATEMTLTMVLSRAPEQQAALEKLLADQKNSASPEYHHWLTPAEMGERFGLSDPDLQAVKGWLEGQGLRVTWVAPSRMFIGFGGAAANVGQAFATEIHNYRVNGADRISVSSDPMIPVALAPVVKSIFGLYTIPDHPMHAVIAPQTARPDLTLSNGQHFIAPADFVKIYDRPPYFSGSQQTIAIVGRSRTDFADFTNFKQLTLSSFPLPTETVPTALGGVDPGPALTAPPSGNTSVEDQLEATLDVMRAGTVAPGASLLLVTATSASGGIGVDTQYLVQTTPLPAQVINISFGACEASAGPSGVNYWDTLFQQAAAEGISVFVASGDSGASGCESYFSAPGVTLQPISPNYICSSSYATCVGGTEFNDTANPGAYWGGSSSDQSSALSYIPEGGWNEPTNSSGATQLASSGGGVSSIIATPSWQTGPGVPSARTGRYTPDLSFSASCHDGYFGCLAAAGADCVVKNGSFRFEYFCGTSAAAPDMAGVAAILNQKMGYQVGNMNPEIYAMGQNQPTSFHDATPATSGVATCDINTPSMCNNSTPGPTALTGGQLGYAVTTGFDLVTGWGSLDIWAFLNNFATALPAPTVTVTPSVTTIVAAQPMTFTVQVAGATGQPTPTGTVTLSTWDYTAPAATLTNGQATISIPAGSLPGGLAPSEFTAQYVPDLASSTTYSKASGMTTVNVTLITPAMNMSFSPANVTTSQDLMVTVTVNGGSGNPVPTGTVEIQAFVGSVPGYSTTGSISGGLATFEFPPGVLPSGTDTIAANYTPDTNGTRFFANASGSQNVTVTGVPKTTPSVTISPSPSITTFGNDVNITVKVAGAAGDPTPTGTLTLTVNGQSVPYGLTGGTAQFPTPPGSLQVGANTLTISYSGDSNYNAASNTATVTVNKALPTVVLSPNTTTVTTADSLSVVIFVNGAAGAVSPTGTITLSSGTYTSAPATVAVPDRVITIPGGTLAAGTDTLAANYSGDGNYNAATGTASVTVTAIPPSFTVGGTAVNISAPGTTAGNTATVTVTPAGGFTGSVVLAAAITSSPAGAQYLPTLSFGTTSPVSLTGTGAATATLTVTTTAPTTGAIKPAVRPWSRWYPLGDTALACLVIVGFRARRRSWRLFAGMLLLLAAFTCGITACGGGGSSSVPTPTPTPGTTPGTYVVAVTGTSGGTSATTSLNLVVQ